MRGWNYSDTQNQSAQHLKQCRGRLSAVRLELVKDPSSFLCPDADALSRTLKYGPLMAISSLTSLGRPSTFLHLSAYQRPFVWVCGISSGIDNT